MLTLPFTNTNELIQSCLILFWSSLILFPIILFGTMKLFRKIGMLDQPHKYPHEWKRAPIPIEVGITLYMNFLILALIYGDLSYRKLLLILVFGFIIVTVSIFDRLYSLGKTKFRISPLLRLLMQIGIGALIGITSIKIGYISNLFWGILYLDMLHVTILGITIYIIPLLFTIIWYVLVMNSLNWSDAVPGMASGLSGIAFIIIAMLTIKLYITDNSLASQENSQFVLLNLAVLIPAISIYWWMDHSRKYFYGGDTASMFLAFMIATLAIISGGKVATVASVLGVYIIDAFYVILVRLYNKKNPLKWDMIHHLHFRLLNLGFSHNFIRGAVYSLALLFWVAAVFLDKIGKWLLFFILIVIVVFLSRILSTIKTKGDK